MATVITKNGRIVRSELSPHGGKYLFPVAKKSTLRQFNRAVRRDSRNIIREQLEENTISMQAKRLLELQEEANRMDHSFWGWFYMDEHEREMARLRTREQDPLENYLDLRVRNV